MNYLSFKSGCKETSSASFWPAGILFFTIICFLGSRDQWGIFGRANSSPRRMSFLTVYEIPRQALNQTEKEFAVVAAPEVEGIILGASAATTAALQPHPRWLRFVTEKHTAAIWVPQSPRETFSHCL